MPGPISWSDRSKSYAGFGQITRTFADDRFEISGGLRYFHDRSETITLLVPGGFLPANTAKANFHAVTPRVVATWLPSPRLTFYASYSEGFRSGLNQTPLTLLAAPLPPAQADKLHNYEIGSKGSLMDGLITYDASVFYIKWNDVQQAGSLLYGNPPVYISATINGVSASGVGTDLSLTLHPAQGMQVGGTFSFNDLKEDGDATQAGIVLYPKGSRLAFSPKYTATAFASYSFPLSSDLDGKLAVSADYHSQEIIRALPNGAQTVFCSPGTVTVTCTSGKPLFVNANLEIATHTNKSISLYVQNLTNWHGLLGPAYSPTTPFRPRPRTFGIQFEAKF